MTTALLLIHYAATLIMTGAIWLAQLSHYPLLALVGKEHFVEYEKEHIRRISGIAWTVIYIELFTGILLMFWAPWKISFLMRAIGLLLIAVIWTSTWIVQYPLHKKLAHGFDAQLHRRLVNTNWIRTITWTLRAILWTAMLWYVMN